MIVVLSNILRTELRLNYSINYFFKNSQAGIYINSLADISIFHQLDSGEGQCGFSSDPRVAT